MIEFTYLVDFIQTVVLTLTTAFIVGAFYEYYRYNKLLKTIAQQRREAESRAYEIAILKELASRTGYSLDIEQVVDIISGSLHQFINYYVAAHVLIEPEELVCKVHVEKSVKKTFIEDMKKQMLSTLAELAPEDVRNKQLDEAISGAILVEDVEVSLESHFTVPLTVGEKVVGVLMVASADADSYTEEQTNLVHRIAKQASNAITRLQSVVREEQAKLNAMVETLIDGVLMTDNDFRVLVANPVACQLVGKKRLEDVSIFDYVDVFGDVFDLHGRLQESMHHGKTFAEKRVTLGDKIFDIIVLPVRGTTETTEGKTLGGVVVFRDMTQIVESERMREDFTSMLVHELRSPLSGLKSIAEVLRGGKVEPGSDSYAEYLSMIYQNSFQMLGLVNDILDVAKLESGKFEVHPKPTDVPEIINNRTDFYRISANDNQINLNVRIDPSMVHEWVVDPRSLQQILNNFLSNALKFSQPGSTVRVFAFVHREGGNVEEELGGAGITLPISFADVAIQPGVVIGVADEGAGIPKDELEMVFDRFKQASGSHKQTGKKGPGLGLAIVRGVAEAHGGEAHLASEEGAGTVAFVTLPENITSAQGDAVAVQ